MLVDYLVYKRALAATGYAGNAGENSERYFYGDIFEVVFATACYFKPLLSGLSALLGNFYL